MFAIGGAAAATAAGATPGIAAAAGGAAEVLGTAGSIAAAREYGPSVMNAAHNAFGGNNVGVHHLSDAAEMNVAHQPGRHTMPNDVDYTQSPGVPQNQEHAARIAAHKRKDRWDPTAEDANWTWAAKKQKAEDEELDPEDEPGDPMVQAMIVGPTLNPYLNSQGCDRNHCWVEAESVVMSLGTGKVAVRLPLSLGGLRYNQPFATYAGMYYAFRPRVFEFRFSPIKYDANYQVGGAPKTGNETVLEVVNGAISGTQQVPATQTQSLNDADWVAQDNGAALPRVGPVAVAIVPRVALDADLEDAMSDANMSVADIRETTYSKSWDCVGGELPTFMVKYTVPMMDEDDSEFVDPFPLASYKTELGDNATQAEIDAHDRRWKLYGKLYACCDQIQKNVECYYVKTRVLVEFRGLRDTYLDPATPGPDIGGVIRQGDRRLVEDHRAPSNGQVEGYANNSNVVTTTTTTDMTQVTTNASNISTNSSTITTHNQRITALEALAQNLKTHAGTVSYDMHIADANHTLHGRIASNDNNIATLQAAVNTNQTDISAVTSAEQATSQNLTNLQTDVTTLDNKVGPGVDALYPTVNNIVLPVPSVSQQVVLNAQLLSSTAATVNGHASTISGHTSTIGGHTTAISSLQDELAQPGSSLNATLSSLNSSIATLQGQVSALNTPTWLTVAPTLPFYDPQYFGLAQPLQFYKEPSGLVHCRGQLTIPVADFTDKEQKRICIIPEGYRPLGYTSLSIPLSPATQNTDSAAELISGNWTAYVRLHYFFITCEAGPYTNGASTIPLTINHSWWSA